MTQMHIDLAPRCVAGTDFEIGRLVLGAMTFGSQVAESDAARMVDCARDAGVTMFDTANAYNGGASEEILGRVIRPFRSRVQLATKIGMTAEQEPPLSPKAVIRATDASLKRLGTDYVDVLYLHTPDARTPFEETLGCLNDLVQAGKVRHIAQSNHAAWQITECHCISSRNGWAKLQISQQLYNLVSRRIEEEYQACSRYLGLFNIAYNPLAGGLLTGKHDLESEPDPGTRFSLKHYRARYWNSEQFKAVAALQGIAASLGMSLVELSYRWLLTRPAVDAVLIGASNLDQLQANLAAAQGEWPESDMLKQIDDVWAMLRGVAPAYNR